MTEIDLTPITRLEYDIDAILNDHAVAEPITRIELILADIVAGNTTTVEPVTRIETYLAIISGADYPVPEPVTRIETFLAIIAGEDYEEPEAVTRLEGLLAEWVEKGSGIWKTVTGTLLHITDALASPVKELSVEIEHATGVPSAYVHRTGKNLLGGDAWFEAGGGTIDRVNRTISGSNSSSLPQLGSRVVRPRYKENTRYTLIIDWETTASNGRPGFVWSYTDGTSDNMYADVPANTRSTSVIVSKANKTLTGISRTSYSGTKKFYVDGCGLFEGVITADDFEAYNGVIHNISWETEAGSITSGTLEIAEDGSVTLTSGGNTYQLASITPISTLAGENNIWTDCGDTTLTYQAVPETAFSDNADTGMADYMTLTE